MRSQKQNNRAPRPFKFKGSERGWSGGRRKDAPLPVPKPTLKNGKSDGTSDEAPPASPVTPSEEPLQEEGGGEKAS